MNFLDDLARSLLEALDATVAFRESDALDKALVEIRKRSNGSGHNAVPVDALMSAVQKFWDDGVIETFRDAYLLTHGMWLPHRPNGRCILDDETRFPRILASVDEYSGTPPAYRRCYQGLMQSYFKFDPRRDNCPPEGRKNWAQLRAYLQTNSQRNVHGVTNPPWVQGVQDNLNLFSDRPCDRYVEPLLRGDRAEVERIVALIGIGESTWFQDELIFSQIRLAATKSDKEFKSLLPRLIEILGTKELLRDRGLVILLDHYARIAANELHPALRDFSVSCWGNPWLQSTTARWGGVTEAAREMVGDWLKLEFIETFFTLLAEDGTTDRRRVNFWKRYVKSIDDIRFALGRTAADSSKQDFVTMRKKMKGLISPLTDGNRDNNAFIMRMGDLVAVEFSGGGALYGYDGRKPLPFNTAVPLVLPVDDRNSLKHSEPTRILWLRHHDGTERWEAMFEETLRRRFRLIPNSPHHKAVPVDKITTGRSTPDVRLTVAASTAGKPESTEYELPSAYEAAIQRISDDKLQNADSGGGSLVRGPSVRSTATEAPRQEPFSFAALEVFARERGLQVEDNSAKGGALWVRTTNSDVEVGKRLRAWSFQYTPQKGWWRKDP